MHGTAILSILLANELMNILKLAWPVQNISPIVGNRLNLTMTGQVDPRLY